MNLNTLGRVTGAPPGFDAATSRLQPDDFIVSVDGQTLEGQPAGTIFRLLNEKLGQNIRLGIRRGGNDRELDIDVGFVELANYQVVEGQSPTPEQLRIREGWLPWLRPPAHTRTHQLFGIASLRFRRVPNLQ